MMVKLRSILVFFVLILNSFYLYSTKYAGEFLDIGGGARALSLGRAFVSIKNDPSVGYWNPSLLPELEANSVIALYSENFGGMSNYSYTAINYKFSEKFYSISLINNYIGDIILTDKANVGNDTTIIIDPTKLVKTSDWQTGFFFSYGMKYSEKINYGANFKYIRKSVANHSANGLGFDFATSYKYSNNITFGMNIQNIFGSYLFWDTGENEVIYPQIKAGISYCKDNFLVSTDLDLRFENRKTADLISLGKITIDPHLGIEYKLTKMINLRSGYDCDKFTFGAGVKIKKLEIDYGYVNHKDLNNSQKISLSYYF